MARKIKTIKQVCDEVGYMKTHFFDDEVEQVIKAKKISGDDNQVKFREYVLGLVADDIEGFSAHARTSQAMSDEEKEIRATKRKLEAEKNLEVPNQKRIEVLTKILDLLES